MSLPADKWTVWDLMENCTEGVLMGQNLKFWWELWHYCSYIWQVIFKPKFAGFLKLGKLSSYIVMTWWPEALTQNSGWKVNCWPLEYLILLLLLFCGRLNSHCEIELRFVCCLWWSTRIYLNSIHNIHVNLRSKIICNRDTATVPCTVCCICTVQRQKFIFVGFLFGCSKFIVLISWCSDIKWHFLQFLLYRFLFNCSIFCWLYSTKLSNIGFFIVSDFDITISGLVLTHFEGLDDLCNWRNFRTSLHFHAFQCYVYSYALVAFSNCFLLCISA